MTEHVVDERALREDPDLADLVVRVARNYKPHAIWFLGSRAEGRARPDSDYDLLVVVDDDDEDALYDQMRSSGFSTRRRLPVDVLVWSKTDFDDDKDSRVSPAAAAFQRGKLLYVDTDRQGIEAAPRESVAR